MDRRNFGQWGLELSAEEFSRALAALGVLYQTGIHNLQFTAEELEARLRRKFSNARSPIQYFFNEQFTGGYIRTIPPAHLFAEAWRRATQEYREDPDDRYPAQDKERLRLEVQRESEADSFWLVEQLSRPEVGVSSVYMRVDEPSADVGWNWPLQVGFLPDSASQKLREAIEELRDIQDWMRPLLKLVNISPGCHTCDLLLMPMTLREALAAALKATTPIEADCVLVLGQVKEAPPCIYPLVSALRSQIRTAGVGLSYVPYERRQEWFGEIIRELSHNDPLDVALYRACRRVKTRTPLLMAARRLVDFSRVSKTVRALSETLASVTESDERIEITDDNSANLGIPAGHYPLPELGKRLRERLQDELKNFPFDSERHMATTIADLNTRAKPIIAAVPFLPAPPPRRIQAQVFDLSAPGERQLLRHALRANAPHAVVVRVGAENQEWVTADKDFHEPVWTNETEQELTVVFSESQLLSEPQTSTIILPHTGDSTECQFFFHVKEGITRIGARMIVLHRNRVLQTALLTAPVVADPAESAENDAITLTIEAVVRPGMGDLEGRQRFDAALVLNHDTERVPGVTKIVGQHASFNAPPDLDKEVRKFDKELTEIANYPDKFKGSLDLPATVEMLVYFARQGSLLYKSIVGDRIEDDAIAGAKRIQVISAEPEARLPIEFFYERRAPKKDAGLCPHAIAALERGECLDTCPAESEQSSVVCPLGFWGLTRVLERHAHTKEFNQTNLDGQYRLQAEPVSTRRHLDVLSAAVLAASNKVDNKVQGGVAKVQAALDSVLKKPVKVAKSWEEWTDEVEKDAPTMLVLLAHTAKSEDETEQELEISDGKPGTRLPVAEIEAEYVRAPETNPPPMIFLMGCETGAPEMNFLGFVPQFRRLGAAIVLCTGATIMGHQAVPVTEEFVKTLARHSAQGNASFGDTMLAVRRKMLAQGLPMVLCLMAYGDADWQLGNMQP